MKISSGSIKEERLMTCEEGAEKLKQLMDCDEEFGTLINETLQDLNSYTCDETQETDTQKGMMTIRASSILLGKVRGRLCPPSELERLLRANRQNDIGKMSWFRSAVNKAVEVGNKNNLTRTVKNYADSIVQQAGHAVVEGAKILQDRIHPQLVERRRWWPVLGGASQVVAGGGAKQVLAGGGATQVVAGGGA
nr:coiled-coil domain-containing protein 18-like [Ipomoea trifida]